MFRHDAHEHPKVPNSGNGSIRGASECSIRCLVVVTVKPITLAFYFRQINLRFNDHKSGVHLLRLSSWTKHVSIINVCSTAIILNPVKKSHRLFAEGTRAMLSSVLACRNISSLQYSITEKCSADESKKQTYSVRLHANIILRDEAQTSEQRRHHSNSVGRACDLSSTSRPPWFLSQKSNALHYPLPETEIHTLHPNVCRHHPCLWSHVQLVRLMPSTDAEFSQIIVSTSL